MNCEAADEDCDEPTFEENNEDIEVFVDEGMHQDDEDMDEGLESIDSSTAYNGSKFELVFNGVYSVTSPELTHKRGDAKFALVLEFDRKCKVWWGLLFWDTWAGMMQIDAGPRNAKSLKKRNGYPFTWRYRDKRTDRVMMGKHCESTIAFNAGHDIEGALECTVRGKLWNLLDIGTVAFEAKRVDEAPSTNVNHQKLWDDFPKLLNPLDP